MKRYARFWSSVALDLLLVMAGLALLTLAAWIYVPWQHVQQSRRMWKQQSQWLEQEDYDEWHTPPV